MLLFESMFVCSSPAKECPTTKCIFIYFHKKILVAIYTIKVKVGKPLKKLLI